MFIRISRLIICVAICIAALPSIARAQETPLPSNVVTATPEWQSKGDITVSGMKAKGNTQGSNLSIAFTNTLQHKQLLSETAMTLNRMNLTTQTMGAMVYNIYTLSTKVGHDVSKKQAEGMLTGMIDLVVKNLKKGQRVRLVGLGILQVKKRAARMGRNPATGEQIKIKASKKVAFRAAKELKEAV